MDLSQDSLYQQTAAPMMQSFLDGYNCTIMAYGQTGSGKTFTMGTSDFNQNLKEDQGIIPRFINDLFEHLNNHSSTTHKFKIKMSFLEIYGEDIYDLLNVSSSSSKNLDFSNRQSLSIREDENGKVFVQGQTEIDVNSSSLALDVLHLGSQNRVTASTAMNSVSSRSHAVLTIYLEQRIIKKVKKDKDNLLSNNVDDDLDDNIDDDLEEKEEFITSKLTFVDLAGSERIKKTGAEGQRLKEGIQINSGLFNLGHVINLLADDQKLKNSRESAKNSSSFIPYRNSKLTHLLKDSLGGNSQTFFLACVSPAESNEQETSSTLNYARQARNIKNKPIKNKKKTREDEMKKLRISMKTWMNVAISLYYNQLNNNNSNSDNNSNNNVSSNGFNSPISRKNSSVMTPTSSSNSTFVYKPLSKLEEEEIQKNSDVQSFISSINNLINEKVEGNQSTSVRNSIYSPINSRKSSFLFNSPSKPTFFNGKKIIKSSNSYDLEVIKEETKPQPNEIDPFSPSSILKSAEYIEEMMGTSENLVEDLKNILEKEKKLLINSNLFHNSNGGTNSRRQTLGRKRLSNDQAKPEEENEEENEEDLDEDFNNEYEEENEEIIEVEKLIKEKEVILEQLEVMIKKNSNIREEIDKIVENINNLEEEKKLLEIELNKLKSSSSSSTSSTSSITKINERYLLIKDELEKMKNEKKEKESTYKVIEKNRSNYLLLERELAKLRDSKKLLLKEKKKQDAELKQLKNENNNANLAMKKLERKNKQMFDSINNELIKKNKLIIIKNKEINKLTKKIKVVSDHLCQILTLQAKNRTNKSSLSTLKNSTTNLNNSTSIKKEFLNLSSDISYFLSSKNLLEEILNNKIDSKLLNNLYMMKLNDLNELNIEINEEISILNGLKQEKNKIFLKNNENNNQLNNQENNNTSLSSSNLSFSEEFQVESLNHKISLSELKIETLTSKIDICSNEIEEIKYKIEENKQANKENPISLSSSFTLSSSSTSSSSSSSLLEEEINWELISQELIKDLNLNQLQTLTCELLNEKMNLKVKVKENNEEIKKITRNFNSLLNNNRILNEKNILFNNKILKTFNKLDNEKFLRIKELFLSSSELPTKKFKENNEESAEEFKIKDEEVYLLNKLYELKNSNEELLIKEEELNQKLNQKLLENLTLLEKNKDLTEEIKLNKYFKDLSNINMIEEDQDHDDDKDEMKIEENIDPLLSYLLNKNDGNSQLISSTLSTNNTSTSSSLILSTFSHNYLSNLIHLYNIIGYNNDDKLEKLKLIISQIKNLKLAIKKKNILFISTLNKEINDEIFSLSKFFYFFYFSKTFLTSFFKFIQQEKEEKKLSFSSLITSSNSNSHSSSNISINLLENSNKIFTLKLLKHIKNNFVLTFFNYIKKFYILKKNFFFLKRKMLLNYTLFFTSLDNGNFSSTEKISEDSGINYNNFKLFYYFNFNFSKEFLLKFLIINNENDYKKLKEIEQEEFKDIKNLETFNKKEYLKIIEYKNELNNDNITEINNTSHSYFSDFSQEYNEIEEEMKYESSEIDDNEEFNSNKLEIKKEMNYFIQHFLNELKNKQENDNDLFIQDLEDQEKNIDHNNLTINENNFLIKNDELILNNIELKKKLLDPNNINQILNFLNQFFNNHKTIKVISTLEQDIKKLNIERIKISSSIGLIRKQILEQINELEINSNEEIEDHLHQFFTQILSLKDQMDIENNNSENIHDEDLSEKEYEEILVNYKNNNNNINNMIFYTHIFSLLTVNQGNFPQGNKLIMKILLKLTNYFDNIKRNRLVLIKKLISFFYSSYLMFNINNKYLSFLKLYVTNNSKNLTSTSVPTKNLLKKESIKKLLNFFSFFYQQIFLNFSNLRKKINLIIENIEEKKNNYRENELKIQKFLQVKIDEFKILKNEEKNQRRNEDKLSNDPIQKTIDSFFSLDVSTCSLLNLSTSNSLSFSSFVTEDSYDEIKENEIQLANDFFINLTEKELNFDEKDIEYENEKEQEKKLLIETFNHLLSEISINLNENKEEEYLRIKKLKDDQLILVSLNLLKEFNENYKQEKFIQKIIKNLSKKLIINEEKSIRSDKMDDRLQKKIILTLYSFNFLLNEVMYLFFLYYLFNLLKKNDEIFHKHIKTLKEYEEAIKINRKKALSGNSRQLLLEEKERNKNKKKYQLLSEKLLTIYSKIYSIIILNDKNYSLNESNSTLPQTPPYSSSIHIEVLPDFSHLSEDGQVLIKEGVSKERLDLMKLNSNSYSSYNKDRETSSSSSISSSVSSSVSSVPSSYSSKNRPPPPPPSITRANSVSSTSNSRSSNIISSKNRSNIPSSLLRSPKGKITSSNNMENDPQYSNMSQ